tara:strand:+ start:1615 stop:1809 length:195 start_codon:yes stop_codon:yes gene_type:complete
VKVPVDAVNPVVVVVLGPGGEGVLERGRDGLEISEFEAHKLFVWGECNERSYVVDVAFVESSDR